MCHLEKEHRLHFILYLLALLDMRNITADCYYLLPEVYDLGLNLEISFRIFRLENAVYFLILITFSLLLVQINQMSPEIWHRYTLSKMNALSLRGWAVIVINLGTLLFFFRGMLLLIWLNVFILREKTANLGFHLF